MVIYATCACKFVAEVFSSLFVPVTADTRLLTDSEELKSDYLLSKIGDGWTLEMKWSCIDSYIIGGIKHKAAQSNDWKTKKMLKNRAIKNNCGDFFVKILGFAWLQKFRSTNEDE
jgi:hypothetical protein